MGNYNGCLECFENPDYIIAIKTGDTKGAGLHNSAHIVLINERGEESRKIQLSGCCVTVFKKGKTDSFNVNDLADFGKITKIKIEQHKEQNDVDWFIEKIVITQINDVTTSEMIFPIQRWLKMDKPLEIREYDCTLPQHDENIEQRRSELILKRMAYSYRKLTQELPARIKNIPRDEVFSNFYKWDIEQRRTAMFSIYQIPKYQKPESWRSFEEIESVFKEKGKFRRPSVLDKDWRSDLHFGRQRLRGCNSRSLQLCTNIPENFAVTEKMVEEYLEGFSFNEAIENKKIFIVNHSILDGLYDTHDILIPSPMALFYLTKSEDLIPIAIQLYQNNDDGKHPVFVPNDPTYTWLVAKMWFNNADAAVQRACFLFTSSHWLLENVSLSVHRTLSPSHPIFRLLAPYIRLVIAVNHFEMHPLMAPGGWVDQSMTMNADGLLQLIEKYWSTFEFKKICCLKEEFESNQVLSAEIISEYPYRDDGLLLHGNIENYARDIVDGYYETDKELLNDTEIQAWATELVSQDSCGLQGVPGDGQFTKKEDLAHVLTCVIYKATVENAALTLPLYDECAFVPNYPLKMRGEPPHTKDPLTEEDVMAVLPTKHITMEIIVINKIISERDSSGLADSRCQYQYDPISKPARERFEGELRATSAVISIRNRSRRAVYDYLNPGKAKPH